MKIEAFTKAIEEYPIHSNGHIGVPKDLADIVESTIGALFIDCNSSLEIVWKIFRKLLEPIIEPDAFEMHPLTELTEVCQKKKLNLQFVDLWKESMNIDVFINEKFVGRGTYGSKKDIARYRAAKNALNNIESVLSGSTSTVEDALVV
ncbi:double-stranded RNA-binding motif protein [Medicago truncatula]|uniref:Double-stranded RNA-binding motif protein n=2 Tax=Medicago truncatula TaxID=3880 RepID=G7J6P1_MEDTR|nr:double-stranded RNA-binding motif protein [Medicago truncatula]